MKNKTLVSKNILPDLKIRDRLIEIILDVHLGNKIGIDAIEEIKKLYRQQILTLLEKIDKKVIGKKKEKNKKKLPIPNKIEYTISFVYIHPERISYS